MASSESIWFSPAYLLSSIRTARASTSSFAFEESVRYQHLRELRAGLVAAASIHIQTGDCIFLQSATKQNDPPDIRILRIPRNLVGQLPCLVEKDSLTTENIEITSYRASRTHAETLHQQLTRTKWRPGYDYNGVVLVETDRDSFHNSGIHIPDISKALWLVVNDTRRSMSGAFFMSVYPERRAMHINVGKTAARMRKLNAPDILVVSNFGVKHRELYVGSTHE